jgi:hypothetical protein
MRASGGFLLSSMGFVARSRANRVSPGARPLWQMWHCDVTERVAGFRTGYATRYFLCDRAKQVKC